jgi:hypothetical protein
MPNRAVAITTERDSGVAPVPSREGNFWRSSGKPLTSRGLTTAKPLLMQSAGGEVAAGGLRSMNLGLT